MEGEGEVGRGKGKGEGGRRKLGGIKICDFLKQDLNSE